MKNRHERVVLLKKLRRTYDTLKRDRFQLATVLLLNATDSTLIRTR
jgi:hypothetical protein